MNFPSITREELIIRRVLDDPSIQNKILPHLKPDLFKDVPLQNICKVILSGYQKYKKVPQAQDLSYGLPDNSAERNKLINIMSYDVESVNKQMAIDSIQDFFKEKKTLEILTKYAEAYHKKQFSDIGATIKDLADELGKLYKLSKVSHWD